MRITVKAGNLYRQFPIALVLAVARVASAQETGPLAGASDGESLESPLAAGTKEEAEAPPASPQDSPAKPVTVEIEPQPLASALKILADQADLQIVFLPATVDRHSSPALKGKLTPDEALAKLLAGTALEFVRTPEGVFIVRERADASAGASSLPADVAGAQEPQRPSRDRLRKPPSRELAADTQQPSSLGDLVVTGSHLRVSPAGARVISLDREDFERMGFSTVQEVIRTLPQNFGGGATEDTIIGLEARTNTAEGTALNLRGLGSSSTLVLLNGRRLAGGGSEGSFTDISNIPLTAVERIDVLPDGASAFYGSDAVGGVVNIILRGDYSGTESQARVGTIPDGSVEELQGAQVIGGRWKSGNALVALEYYRRDNLLADERALAASDLRPFGGTNFDTRNGNPGTIIAGGLTWAIPAGQDGTALTPGDLVAGTQNLHARRAGADLLPRQERASVVSSLHQDVNSHIDIFLDGLFSRREFHSMGSGVPLVLVVPPSNPFHVDPTGGNNPVQVAYNFMDDLGRVEAFGSVDVVNAALGASVQKGDWRVTGYAVYGLEEQVQRQRNLVNFGALLAALGDPDPATAFNPFGDGSHTNPATLEDLRTNSRLDVESELRATQAVADGSLFDTGAGEVRLAFGAGHRRQSLDSSNVSQVGIGGTNIQHFSQRSVTAAFGELLVPLFSPERRAAGLEELRVSIAGRMEDHSDFGEASVPAVGMVWQPLKGLSFRGTWSRSFKAPGLADLDETQNGTQVAPLRDSASPSGFTTTLVWFGKNQDLDEETAKSWTLGLELTPAAAPALSVGVTYFDIEFNDRIQMTNFSFADLADPIVAEFVNRAPTAANRERACRRGSFFGNPADCLNAPIGALLDLRVHNIAVNRTRGLDVLARHELDARSLGSLKLSLDGTYLLEFSQATTRGSPLVDLLDTPSNPLDLRLRAGLTWERAAWSASGYVNYADEYRDTASTPDRRVGSWTTFDLQLAYHARSLEGLPGGLHLALSLQNAFDTDPPFVNNAAGIGYDEENADLLGRVVRFHVRKDW